MGGPGSRSPDRGRAEPVRTIWEQPQKGTKDTKKYFCVFCAFLWLLFLPSLRSAAGFLERLEGRRRAFRDFAPKRVVELDTVFLERRSGRPMDINQCLGISHRGGNLSLARVREIALPQDDVVRSGDSGFE